VCVCVCMYVCVCVRMCVYKKRKETRLELAFRVSRQHTHIGCIMFLTCEAGLL